jgi:hypothetical protein
LAKKIGELSTLIFILFFIAGKTHAQDSTLQISDLRHLAKQFQSADQSFLSYVYNLSYYHLTADSAAKLAAGFDALKACIRAKRFDEGKQVIGLLASDFPQLENYLKYQFGYALIRNGEYGEGDKFVREVAEIPALHDRCQLMRAYTKLVYFNHPQGSLELLSEFSGDRFEHGDSLMAIKAALSSKPRGVKKYNAIAVPMSVILPGSGQFYAGFHFDAVQSFGFNLITGYATYASWRYELDKPRGDRNYVLPILSSVASGIFYLSNIFSTVNAVNKANLYRENQHYRAIIEKFRFILSDDEYFMNVQLEF